MVRAPRGKLYAVPRRGVNMAGFDDLGDGVRKLFLVGVGAVATGAEKSTEIVNKLVEKGELTVAQGKAVNEELKHTIKNAAGDTFEAVLRAKLKTMTPEERAAWVKSAQKIADDLDAEPVEVKVEDADDAEKDKPAE